MEFEFGEGALGESLDEGTVELLHAFRGQALESSTCSQPDEVAENVVEAERAPGIGILVPVEIDPEAADPVSLLAGVEVVPSRITEDHRAMAESVHVAVPTRVCRALPRPRSRTRRYKCQREGCGAFFRRHKPGHVYCLSCRNELVASAKIEREMMALEREVACESRARTEATEAHVDALFLAWKRGELPFGVRVDVKNGRQVLLRDGKRSYTRYLKKGETPPVIRIFNATSA